MRTHIPKLAGLKPLQKTNIFEILHEQHVCEGSDEVGRFNDDSRSCRVTSKQPQSSEEEPAQRLALNSKKGLALFMTPIKAAVNYRVLGL